MTTRLRWVAGTWIVIGAGCAAAVDNSPRGDDDPYLVDTVSDRFETAASGGWNAPPVEDERLLIDEYIQGIDFLAVDNAARHKNSTGAAHRSGDYVCQVENYSETQQYDRIVAYAANSESMWPGAIVQGDSVYTGLFTQAVFDRNPLTFSVSLNNIGGPVSGTMEAPSLSSFREELSRILASEVTGSTPADMTVEIEEVHSEEQLELALGVGGSFAGVTIDLDFNFENSNIRSRHVVRYHQKYFTVDVDQPRRPSDFFADSVMLESVSEKFGLDSPPTYVSSITYGRMILFTIESEYSSEEIGAALDFAYNGGGYDVHADFSVSYSEMLDRSHITAYIVGGDGGASAEAIAVGSYEALIDLIGSGGNFSATSPGAPIAYKLAYLRDNSPARMSLTSDYDITVCDRVNQGVLVTLQRFQVERQNTESPDLYGSIIAFGPYGASHTLFSVTDEADITIDEGRSWPEGGFISSGIVNLAPESGQSLVIYGNLWDSDPPGNPADHLGEINLTLPFELGWRRENLVMRFTGDGAIVNAYLSIRPI